MAKLKVEEIGVSYNEKNLFKPLSFFVYSGEVITLMGASGSGKSSLLSYIAGSMNPLFKGFGRITLGDREIQNLPLQDRKVGLLYQDDLLFPHLTVGENLLYPISKNSTKHQRIESVKEALRSVSMASFYDRLPQTLSGGERARISLLRALMAEPELILLDEPFSKLDKLLKGEFKNFVFSKLKQLNISCVLVTHDLDDSPANAEIIHLNQ